MLNVGDQCIQLDKNDFTPSEQQLIIEAYKE